MNKQWSRKILTAAVAAALGVGSMAAFAQPGPPPGHGRYDERHNGRHDDRSVHRRYDDRNDRRAPRYDNRHDNRRPDYYRNDGHDMRGAGPDHRWMRGTRVPPQYRTPHYVVNDWRVHQLTPPPRGYQWIQNGADYVLVAIATGVIASIILNSSY